MTPRPHGLTLIELIVALAVFAVLGTLTYRGTAQLIDSRQRLGGELERWRAVERALNLIETDLQQLAQPLPVAGGAAAIELYRSGADSELRFLSLSSADTPHRIAFRHAGTRLEWLRWPGRDAHETPRVDTILDAVGAVRWRFLGSAGWLDHWPPESSPGSVPAGVELQLDLPGSGTLTRLYALR